MKKTIKINLFFILLAALVTLFIYSCNNSTTTPTTPTSFSLGGTVNFLDNNRVSSGGYYNISVFTSWPPTGAPTAYDTLTIIPPPPFSSTFTFNSLNNGTYYLAVAWTRTPYVTGGNYVLGLYKCNPPTSSCQASGITINGANITNISVQSYLDTAHAIFKF